MTFTPRSPWADAPAEVRAAVAEALGAPIVAHTDLHGGMSPGPAARLRLADGRQVFVKAVSAEVRVHNHRMILQEAGILDILPETVPAPRRLATVEAGPWVALATTWAAGSTPQSWTDASIAAVATACRRTNAHRAPGSLPPVAQRIFDFDGWDRLLELGAGAVTGHAGAGHAGAGHTDTGHTDAGHAEAGQAGAGHAEAAAEVVAGWESWTAGDALVHRDLRLDNTAVGPRGESAVLLDWAYASAGAPWIDLAQMAADVVATGHVLGPDVATDRAYRLLRTLPPEASRFVVGLAGMWTIRAATIPDTVMPTISAWRRARAAALRPLVERLIAELRGPARARR